MVKPKSKVAAQKKRVPLKKKRCQHNGIPAFERKEVGIRGCVSGEIGSLQTLVLMAQRKTNLEMNQKRGSLANWQTNRGS